MNFSIPAPLWSLHQRILDEHGRLNEIPAGKAGDCWLTLGNTHTDFGAPYGQPVTQFGADNAPDGTPKLMAYSAEIDNSFVVDRLPAVGTAVWQLKGRMLDVVRTSIIASYRSGFICAELKPAGPYPGTPIGGDSGSVCYARQDGAWRVLGVVNYAGTCSVPFWGATIPMPNGLKVPPRNQRDDGQYAQDSFYGNEPTIIPFPMRLFLPSAPTSRRVVGMFQEGDDGTDNVVLDVPCSKDPQSVVVQGLYTDQWMYPDTRPNWIIRAIRLDPQRIRLFFKASRPTESYFVIIDGMPTITAKPVADIVEKPAENLDTLDVIFLQAELAELRKQNAKLAMDNADLRADIANEQAKSAALQAKIDSFRAAINSIIQ